jgi:hypothetical protein
MIQDSASEVNGAAVLMAVNTVTEACGLLGSCVQTGVPAGLLLAEVYNLCDLDEPPFCWAGAFLLSSVLLDRNVHPVSGDGESAVRECADERGISETPIVGSFAATEERGARDGRGWRRTRAFTSSAYSCCRMPSNS